MIDLWLTSVSTGRINLYVFYQTIKIMAEAPAEIVAPVTPIVGNTPVYDDGIKEYEARRSRNELVFVLSLVAVVVAAVIITVSVVTVGGKKSSESTTRSPTAPPTVLPTLALIDTQARLDYVREQLRRNEFTSSYLTDVPETVGELNANSIIPIEQAAYWLANEDELVDEKNIIRRLTLATIYLQNGGANWNNSTSWLSSESHCNWYGVSCCRDFLEDVALTCFDDDQDSIADLTLDDNQLAGQVTPIFALLTDLRSLDLSFNQLTGTLPSAELGSLPILMALYLQSNSFSGQLDESLRANGVLQTLFVQRNNFTGDWPTSFCPECHDCRGNIDVFGLDCDKLYCNADCCRSYNRCYYD